MYLRTCCQKWREASSQRISGLLYALANLPILLHMADWTETDLRSRIRCPLPFVFFTHLLAVLSRAEVPLAKKTIQEIGSG